MTAPKTRQEIFRELFPDAPAYRFEQVEAALFRPGLKGWREASNLPGEMRVKLTENLPWLTYREVGIVQSARDATQKAALTLLDGAKIETVLLPNRRGQWTICVSSQVGCGMKCAFCATGRLGLTRDLSADEIVDQYRFWATRLADSGADGGRISNVVLMGMGEPLANYDQGKAALRTLLQHTDLGPTHVTVSTVGLLPRLDALLEDADWPPVRLAVSLHCAEPLTRKKIMPTTPDRFLPMLADWCRRYLKKFGNRRHYLTFEYLLLDGVNDTPRHAALLAKFAAAAGRVKINLIPYNMTATGFAGSSEATTKDFIAALAKKGVDVTRRRSLGADIAAACGQLIGQIK